MEDIFNNINTAIVLVNLKTHIIEDINLAALELFGYTTKETLVGEDCNILMPEKQRQWHKTVVSNPMNYYRIMSNPRLVQIEDRNGNSKKTLIDLSIKDDTAILHFHRLEGLLRQQLKAINNTLAQMLL